MINSAKSVGNSIRVSPRKLNAVAALIRNMKASEALVQLTFCKRRVASDVKKTLMSAIANAENNHGLDIDNLVVTSATVGKGLLMKRVLPRAKGRATGMKKFFSNLYITLTEIRGS